MSGRSNSIFESIIADIKVLLDLLIILRDGREAIGFIPQLRTLELARVDLDPVLNAYLEAVRAIFYAMTAFGVIGFLSAIFTGEHTLQKTDLGRQQFEDAGQH